MGTFEGPRTTDAQVQSWLDVLGSLLSVPRQPSSAIYWPYLSVASLLATVVAWRGGRRGWALLRFVFPRRIWTHRSTRHDGALFVINALLHTFVMLPLLAGTSGAVATWVWGFLLERVSEPMWSPSPSFAIAVMTLAAVIAADLGFYLSHRLQHQVPALWAFHQVHHSAEVMQPLTVFRRHPIDICIESLISGTLVGAAFGVAGFVFGEPPLPFTVLGVNLVLFVFLLAGFNLQHSHVPLSFGVLERVFISPAAHQIHHSDAPEHWGRNLGNMFSVWDRWWGTRWDPREDETIRFGLGADQRRWHSLWALYILPFVDAARSLGNVFRRRTTTTP